MLLLLLLLSAGIDDEPAGVRFSAALSGGYVGGDVVAGASVGAGIQSAPFALHLEVPVLLRAVDLPPSTSAALPSFCAWLRCEELLAGERLDPTAIARVVDELRILNEEDAFFLRAGQLTASLGAGAVLDRFTTASSWDRRTSGAYAALHLPWKHLDVEAFAGDVTSLELLALRARTHPLDDDLWLALDVGVDPLAPVDVVDALGEPLPGAATRPVTSTALTGGWDVGGLVGGDWLHLAPRAELGVMTGLSSDGGDGFGVGAGAAVGNDAGVDLDVVDVRLKLTLGFGSDGWRRGYFSTFYGVERRAALAGASVEGGSLLRVPAPWGGALDARLEASFFDAVAPLLRLHVENAPGSAAAEAGVVLDVEPVRLSLSVVRRGWDQEGAALFGTDVEKAPVLGVLEASWRVWGPFSLGVRWMRLPRFRGGLQIDDDVLVTLSANTVLAPRGAAQ